MKGKDVTGSSLSSLLDDEEKADCGDDVDDVDCGGDDEEEDDTAEDDDNEAVTDAVVDADVGLSTVFLPFRLAS